jgi:hypothetical protein
MLSDGAFMLDVVNDDIAVRVSEVGRMRVLPRRGRPPWPSMSDPIDTEAQRCSG